MGVSGATAHLPQLGVRRGWLTQRQLVLVTQVVGALGLLAAWQYVSGNLIAEFYVGSPERVWGFLYEWVSTGELVGHAGATMGATTAGFLLGSAVAIPAGILLGANRHLYRVFDPFVNAGYSVPKIALAPLLVIWLGLGMAPKIALAAMITFFLVFHVTVGGIRDVDADLTDQVYLFGGGRRAVLTKVIIPTISLHILHGLRLSFPYALHGAIVGELIAARQGLGYLLNFARGTYNTSMMFAALVALMLFAVLLVKVIDLSGRWLPDVR